MNNLQKHSERELAELLQRGDASVVGEVYAQYAGYLTGICSRYIIDNEDVRDVLQECFIKIFNKGTTFQYRGEGSLKAWLRRIVVNESISYIAKKRHSLVVFDDKQMTDSSDESEEMTILPEIPTEVLYQMIRALPPGYRTVFNLYAIEGRSHKEIAELLGIQEPTSASQLSRAKRMLTKWIKEYITNKQEPR